MELPHLGNNCALKECNQLDFLPVKCDSCSAIFCIRHYRYEAHQCPEARNKDNQVPACPLCSQPVPPGDRNQLPDVAVSEHIDKYCKRNELLLKTRLQTKKTNLQACSFGRCKQKDVIYLECNDCRAKFCIKHRHPSDHSCSGPQSASTKARAAVANNWQSFKGSCSTSANSGYELLRNKAQQISKSGQAALNRISTSSSSTNRTSNTGGNIRSLQGNLSEQEALAIALSESKGGTATTTGTPNQFLDEDQALARALHESQQLAAAQQAARQNRTSNSNNKDSCVLS